MDFLITFGSIAGILILFVLFKLLLKLVEKALQIIDEIEEDKR